MNQSLIVTGYDDIYRVHKWAERCFRPRYVTEIISAWNGLSSFAVLPTGRKHAESYREDEIDMFQRVLLEVKTDVEVVLVEDSSYDSYEDGEYKSERKVYAERLV